MNDLEIIKEVIIQDPPTYYNVKKVNKSKLAGHDVYDKHYLTANLFYIQNVHFMVIKKITNDCKRFLVDKIGYLPELEKLNIEIEVRRTKDIDLDNVAYFWCKLLLDVLKTPSSRQTLNANKKGNDIISMNVLDDDSTKYIDSINFKYKNEGNFLIFRFYGRVKSEQVKLDLFFK